MAGAVFTGNPDPKDVAAFAGRLGDDLNTQNPDLEDQASKGATEEDTDEEDKASAKAKAAESDESDESAEEEADESQEAAEAESEEDDGAETEDAVSTLSDLASAFETDEATLKDIIQVTVGDETVSLGEALAAHAASPAAAKELEGLKQERAQIAATAKEFETQVGEQMRTLAAHAQVFADEYDAKYKDVPWTQLKQDDPSQYLLLQNEQQQDKQKFRNAVDALQTVDEKRKQGMQRQQEEFEASETQALLAKVPEWKDQKVAHEAMGKIQDFLLGRDFKPEEIKLLNDHRYMLIVRDAQLYSELKKKAPGKLKSLKGLPKPAKTISASARKSRSVKKKVTEASKLRSRLKQTGDERDAAAIFEQEVDFDEPPKRP